MSDISEPSEFISFTRPEQVRGTFRSGDLREAAAMLFEPSRDPNITGGAARVFAMKVNPATQSTGFLDNSGGNVIRLESEDYGAFTQQISISLSDATAGLTGKRIVIQEDDTIETGDGIGGDAAATLVYTPAGGGRNWQTADVTLSAAGQITVAGTNDSVAGLDGDLTGGPWTASTATITPASDEAGKTLTLYGLVGTTLTTETLTLSGTSAVTSANTYAEFYGAVLSADATGDVVITDSSTGSLTISAGSQSVGVINARGWFVNGALTLVRDAAGTEDIHIFGRNTAGVAVRETVTLTGTTDVVTTATTWAEIDAVSLIELPSGGAVSFSGNIAQTNATVVTNLRQGEQFFDARTDVDIDGTTVVGFAWTNNVGQLTRVLTELDEIPTASAVSALTSGGGAGLQANVFDIINWINGNSDLVTARIVTTTENATLVRTAPDNTPSAQFLTGGVEGVTAFSDWQQALNLLQQIRVNTIVVLTGQSAVHQALAAHCNLMAGIGRNERDGLVGLVTVDSSGNPTGTTGDLPFALAPRADLLSQVQQLNTRHLRACGQVVDRFDTTGERRTFAPWFQACIAAGMQAGSPVGVSLRHKFANVLNVDQSTGASGWTPTEDSEELIQGGLLFMETVEGQGIRFVRNVTTFLQSDNLAFTEASVNEAANFSVFTFRTNLEFAVGRRGFANTLAAVRGIAINSLGLLTDEGIITQYRALSLTLNADVLDVSVEIAPILPINFVRSVVHLVTVQQTA